MPKSTGQKLKLIYILDFLKQSTDDMHGVTMQEILTHLERLDIKAERKSVYEDIALLTDVYGADIICCREGRRHEYRLMSREFQLAEVRLLADAVSSSKFITRKKSDELIKKIGSLVGGDAARTVTSQVVVAGRIKSMEETIYYNVDIINSAISDNVQITFNYFEWLANKQKRLRRDGARYTVSPLSLCWDDENYYLIADEDGSIKHFRVDKMTKIAHTATRRNQNPDFNANNYAEKVFGMFGGTEQTVTIECHNSLAGAIIDRFGKDIILIPDGDIFRFTVKVQISPQFYGWLCGFGDKLKIISPQSVVSDFKTNLKNIQKQYN